MAVERSTGTHYVVRLIPPRPSFDQDLDDREREIMGRHAAYYGELAESGKLVVYGPVRDGSGAWGLGVFEAASSEEVHALAGADPAVTEGLMTPEIGAMLVTILRT
jgi:uncharacterized protein